MNQSLVVISSYPPKGSIHHKTVIGGASYTKITLLELTKYADSQKTPIQISVLANKIPGENTNTLDEKIHVKRIWERDNILAFPSLLKEIVLHHSQSKTVLLQMELSTFGGALMLVQAPFFALLLRLLNKKLVVVFHEVIFDSGTMAGHINVKPKSIHATILNAGLRFFYTFLLKVASSAIVFDETLRLRLKRFGDIAKVSVIPIAVTDNTATISKNIVRDKLGIPQHAFVLMTFGFLAWHKGTDWIIKAFSSLPQDLQKNLFLVVGGGPNPNHTDKKHYQAYLEELQKMAQQKNILLSGFIPEETMSAYFIAADLVVFPYRTLISSSAVLSQAFNYEKPILVADTLRETLLADDITHALRAHKLSPEMLTFPLNQSAFAQKIAQIQSNNSLQQQLASFAKTMREKRSWQHIRKSYFDSLFQ